MAEFAPLPFGRLAARMFRELELRDSVFDLPRRSFFLGDPRKDFSVRIHGRRVPCPLGPAAGPHTQLAQNIVLSWLGGARFVELKTVQSRDRLTIPRPCIDMRTVGYNVEWSQELRLEQSLEEYVKASMLIDLLQASGRLAVAEGYRGVLLDLSVGYDLEGIRSERLRAFTAGMKDARPIVDRLRAELPPELKRWRDLDFRTRLAETATLSTFHGCPPEEIERIAEFLMESEGLSCTVKLNPTLLGADEVRRLFNRQLGYSGIRVPDEAFRKDASWKQVVEFVARLRDKAARLGRGFGVKFCNTLVVENPGDFLPKSERTAYLSGPPLHVLAMHLVRRFRREFGVGVPVSFSGGINRMNFPDAVALGLAPVTVCSDLLGPGGYGRLRGYLEELSRRMDAVGADSVEEFVLRQGADGAPPAAAPGALIAAGTAAADNGLAADGAPPDLRLPAAVVRNTEAYVERATRDPRYGQKANSAPPRKIRSRLGLFNCLACDKCVPACPNDANFALALSKAELPIVKAHRGVDRWDFRALGSLRLDRRHQLANFADFCNECGNCDVFCPEDGGPYRIKPRFFGGADSWTRARERDGFYLERAGGRETIYGRFEGREYSCEVSAGRVEYRGKGFRVRFLEADPAGTLEGEADGEVDLTYFYILNCLRKAIYAEGTVNYVNA